MWKTRMNEDILKQEKLSLPQQTPSQTGTVYHCIIKFENKWNIL